MDKTSILAMAMAIGLTGCAGQPKYAEIDTPQGKLMLVPMADNAIRVKMAGEPTHKIEDMIYLDSIANVDVKVETDAAGNVVMKLKEITARYDAATDALTFSDKDGKPILAETANGRRMEASTIQGEPTYSVAASFVSPEDEFIYGTGQFQDGYLNIRGLSRRLTQVNTQISIPVVLSNKGYGFIWNNHGMADFNPASESIALSKSGAEGKEVTVDVTSDHGNRRERRRDNTFEGVIDVPQTGEYSILLDVGQRMARKHKLSIDDSVYVDFNNLWLPPTTSFIATLGEGKHTVKVEGVNGDKPTVALKAVDGTTSWSSPVAQGLDYTVIAGDADDVIETYRDMTGHAPMMPRWAMGYIHCRERYDNQPELLENAMEFRQREIPLDVIVQDWQWWGKTGWNSMKFDSDKYPDPKAMVDSLHNNDIKLMLSVWSKIDANSELGKKVAENGYYIPESDWVDFFDQDAADFYWSNFSGGLLKPYGIDAWWQDATEPENDDLQGRRIAGGTLPGEVYRNAYPMFVNRTVYSGLRKDDPDRRAMILTRSGFPGMQRYGAATWSGDVGNDWETLRRQIAGGLGQMATGLPWWTYDAGGFFRPWNQYDNADYHEVFLRWLQTATFLPLMRTHGYMSNTEPWRYGEQVDSISRKYIGLRYKLLPYIYSNAAKVTSDGYTFMRPLVFDFPDDKEALSQDTEYMFGKSILVAPVLAPGVSTWDVYLPSGNWIDFWTGEEMAGGRTVKADATIDKIPLFVKAGSIIPTTEGLQSTDGYADAVIKINVYPGEDGSFTLYEDDGKTYDYEKGKYSTIEMDWDDDDRTLTIGSRKGSFAGMPSARKFDVAMPDGSVKSVDYSGSEVKVKM